MKNICVFMLAAFVLLPGIAWADISVSNVTTLPASIKPGVLGTITMGVSNPDAYDANGVSGQAFGNENVNSAGSTFLGDFKPGVSSVLSFPFSVPLTTKAGIYTLQYRLSWTNVNGSRYKTLYLPITVSNPPLFSMETADVKAYTNNDFTVNGTIFNSGGAASAVRLQASSDKVVQLGQNPSWVGEVNKSAQFQLKFSVAPGVSSGSYSVPIMIYSRDEVGQDAISNTTLRISITQRAPSFVLAAESDKPLVVGARARLMVKVTNTGDDGAYQVRLTLPKSAALTPLGMSDADIGTIKSGESMEASFDVGVNSVPPGFYASDFIVRYHNKDGEAQEDKTASTGINIEGKNDVSVFVSSKPSPLVSGSPHTLSVLVSNIGSAPIKALTVKIGNGFFSLQEAQDTQFIGGLNEDDFSTVQYKIRVNGSLRDGTYPFAVELRFKDAYNIEHTVSKAEKLNVVSKETSEKMTGNGGTNIGMVVVGIAILAAIAYFAYKRFWHKGQSKKP